MAAKNAAALLVKSDKAASAMTVTLSSPYFGQLPETLTTNFRAICAEITSQRAEAKKCIDEGGEAYDRNLRDVDKLCASGIKADQFLSTLMRGFATV